MIDHRRLAVAVLRRAVLDMLHDPRPWVRDHAAAWLTRESDSLRWWCHVAGLPTDRVQRAARRLVGSMSAGLGEQLVSIAEDPQQGGQVIEAQLSASRFDVPEPGDTEPASTG